MHTVSVFPPSELASKKLKITQYENGKRKVQISSNWLPLFLFEKGTKVIETSLGAGCGYCIELAENLPNIYAKAKMIYSRVYTKRKNNPFETLFETSSQKLLDESLPKNSDQVHVTFTKGKIYVRPVSNVIASRLESLLKNPDPYSIFAACSSGVDCHASQSAGFTINSILEYRPNESRDKSDLTETGALSAIGNVQCKHLFNEDITTVNTDYLKWATKNAKSSLFTISLQCDDHSNVKANSLKDKSFLEGTSTLDMAYDGLRIIEALKFPMVLMEQVASFTKSAICDLWDLRLRKMGYKTYSICMDARDHDGYSSRNRYFHFATMLPVEFIFPEATPRNTSSIWDSLVAKHLDNLRDVSHSKAIQDGFKTKRIRTITKESVHSPTLLKSQRRMAKDSLVVVDGERILFPDLAMERDIMGIPESFNSDVVSETLTSEIYGQAVDYPLYQRIMMKIKEHISSFIEQCKPEQIAIAS